jgi:hypothetical protein
MLNLRNVGRPGDIRDFDYSWTVPVMHDTPYDMRKLLFRPNSLSFCDFLNYGSLDKDTVVRERKRAMPIATVIDGRSRYEN